MRQIIINGRIEKKLEDIELLLDAEHACLGVRDEDIDKDVISQIKEHIEKIRGLVA